MFPYLPRQPLPQHQQTPPSPAHSPFWAQRTQEPERELPEIELQERQKRNQESLDVLLWNAPSLLGGLEQCRTDRVPLTVHIEGYEHSAEVVLSLLRCAHLYGVSVTLVPFAAASLPDQTHLDPTRARQRFRGELASQEPVCD